MPFLCTRCSVVHSIDIYREPIFPPPSTAGDLCIAFKVNLQFTLLNSVANTKMKLQFTLQNWTQWQTFFFLIWIRKTKKNGLGYSSTIRIGEFNLFSTWHHIYCPDHGIHQHFMLLSFKIFTTNNFTLEGNPSLQNFCCILAICLEKFFISQIQAGCISH